MGDGDSRASLEHMECVRNGPAILAVDDYPANLLAIKRILDPLGHELVRAHSGEEALRHASEREFAVILMDAHMPGMDGYETTKLIKQHPKSRSVPVIFLTGIDRDPLYTFRGYEYGAVDYLVKPVEPHVLRSKIGVFVELFIRQEQIRQQAELLQAERVARAAAEAKIAAREEILAIVSHDLGNPIAAASTCATLLQRRGHAIGDPSVKRQAELVHRSLDRMHRLVTDLLQVSQIEGGRLPLDKKEQDLTDIVAQAMEVLTPLANQKSQQLTQSVPVSRCTAVCDRDRIHQVLSNLVGNAVKFAPSGTRIDVALTENGDEFEVSVRDSGPGIGAMDAAHIFDRYWQAAGQRRRGIGLGLAIAKGIVQAHGGRMWVESRLGCGSTFYFSIPKKAGRPSSAPPAAMG